MASGRITGSSNNGRYLYIDWSSVGNESNNTSSFTAKMYLYGDVQGNATSGSAFTVDGTDYSIAQYWDNWGTGQGLLLKTVTKTITHGSNGQATVPMSGSFIYNGSFTSVSISGSATLDNLLQPPPIPPTGSISGRYEKGSNVTITFTGTPGTTTYYNVWYRIWYESTNTYSSWIKHGTNLNGSYSILNGTVTGNAIQMGVTAVNDSGESPMRTTGYIYHQGVSPWNGTSFGDGNIKVWNGTSWVQGYTRIWNGTSWAISQ